MCNEHDVKMLRTLKKVFMEEKEKVVEQLLRIEVLEDIDPDKKLDMIWPGRERAPSAGCSRGSLPACTSTRGRCTAPWR